MSEQAYKALAEKTATQFGLPVPLFLGLVDHESKWNPKAVSSAGALGLGQVMPANLEALGIDRKAYDANPALQLNASATMYREAIRAAKGDPVLALAYYNASPKAVNKFLRGGNLPTETANYVPTVLWNSQKYGGKGVNLKALDEVKKRFKTRLTNENLFKKTGIKPSAQSSFVDPAENPGLDVAPDATRWAGDFDTKDWEQSTALADDPALAMQLAEIAPGAAPAMEEPGAAPSGEYLAAASQEAASVDGGALQPTQIASIESLLGVEPEAPKHGYPDWFAKMVGQEVESA